MYSNLMTWKEIKAEIEAKLKEAGIEEEEDAIWLIEITDVHFSLRRDSHGQWSITN